MLGPVYFLKSSQTSLLGQKIAAIEMEVRDVPCRRWNCFTEPLCISSLSEYFKMKHRHVLTSKLDTFLAHANGNTISL